MSQPDPIDPVMSDDPQPEDASAEQAEPRQDGTRPEHSEVDQAPTVASVATVASTSGDVEAANPSHPDRPVGVNVDTASVGLDEELVDATEPEDDDDALPAELDDSGLFEGDDDRFGSDHVGAGPRPADSVGA